MASYSDCASLLERLQNPKPRPEKAAMIAAFLRGLPPDQICPGLRLLAGELAPPWEAGGPGAGMGLLIHTLSSLVGQDAVSVWLARTGEIGELSRMVRRHLSQSTLCQEPLSLMTVYSELGRLSRQQGPGSWSRRESILKGLFLKCNELEACYLARTAVRSSGWQPGYRLLAAAIALAFSIPEQAVWSAYCWQPDPGRMGSAAALGRITSCRLTPQIPCRQMRIPFSCQLPAPAYSWIYLPRCRGLRVQVHISSGSARIFTTRRWEVSASLATLAEALRSLGLTAVLEGELLGFRGGPLDLPELVRFLNRRHQARRSATWAGLAVWDLLYLDGSDLTEMPYQERWDLLTTFLAQGHPGPGQVVLARRMNRYEAEQVLSAGGQVVVRDGCGHYHPGGRGEDTVVRGRGPDRCSKKAHPGGEDGPGA